MSHLILVLGGARSGKSALAEQWVEAAANAGDTLYVGTLLPGDPDSDARIAAHLSRRPASWTTTVVGADGDVAACIDAQPQRAAVLLDGFELALALAHPPHEEAAAAMAIGAADACRRAAAVFACVVSSEVGLGVHPETPAGIAFRDRAGAANQALAARADEVVLVIAGLPVWLKGAAR